MEKFRATEKRAKHVDAACCLSNGYDVIQLQIAAEVLEAGQQMQTPDTRTELGETQVPVSMCGAKSKPSPKQSLAKQTAEQRKSKEFHFAKIAELVYGGRRFGEVFLNRVLLCLQGIPDNGLPLGGKDPTTLFPSEDFG